jgi:protein SCO1/2
VIRLVLGGWVLLVLLGLGWVLWIWEPPTGDAGAAATLDSLPKGGDFRLQSANGPVGLEDLRGQVVVLYFGYTFCPDICPTSLALLTLALEQLSPSELEQVQPLFVSVDPERDTPERLAAYAEYFHPRILGLTGDPAELAATAELYGAAYRKVEQGSAAGYLVDHSAMTYIIGRQGRLAHSLVHGTPPETILALLRQELDVTPAQ